LAIPPGSNCQRLLLVARDSSYQSGLVDKLKKCQSLNVRGVENDCELFLDESPLPLENKEVRASIYKDANFASPVQKILITKSADESADEGKEDVIIFTVSRG
jgi:hypothetical protein